MTAAGPPADPMNEKTAGIIRRVEEFISRKDDALAIPRDAGEFIHALLLATRAKRALEIGTSYGYSGLWIASALRRNGGILVTIDMERRKHDVAAKYFADAELADCVRLETGIALEVIERLEGHFDFVLVDADKENCIRYVEAIEGKLSSRSIVLTDNTLTHAEQLADYLDWIRNHNAFKSASIPIGNGMEMSVKV